MKTNGRRKCDILKELRKKIAEENGIAYVPHECHETGECPGTCPRCDQELQQLHRQIMDRPKASKASKAAAAALFAGMLSSTTLTSCEGGNGSFNPFAIFQNEVTGDVPYELEGDVAMEELRVDSSMVGTDYNYRFAQYDSVGNILMSDSVTIRITEEMVGNCLGPEWMEYVDVDGIDFSTPFGKAVKEAMERRGTGK